MIPCLHIFFLLIGHNMCVDVTMEDHAIYLSTIDMKIMDSKIALEVRVFEDDLRDVLRAHRGYRVDTTSLTFLTAIDDYFTIHLDIRHAEDKVSLSCTAAKLVGDSYQLSFIGEFNPSEEGWQIKADYFMEVFATQQNVIDMQYPTSNLYHIFKKGSEIWSP